MKFVPLSAAHLYYQYKFVGGEYTYEEEVRYWARRGGQVAKDQVVFYSNGKALSGLPSYKWLRSLSKFSTRGKGNEYYNHR